MARPRSNRRQRRQKPAETRERGRARAVATTVPVPDTRPLAFVIMPFGLVFDRVFEGLFVPLLSAAGYRVRRADTLLNQRAIMRDVIEGIDEADLIFADLSGGNANVFYELGIAHALRKKTVLVAQRRDDIPFDLRGYKNHVYRVEFASAPTFVDDMTVELKPFLEAARRNEVLFGNPFSDFSQPKDESEAPEDEGGLLDNFREYLRRVPDYGQALEEASAITSELGRRQEELNAEMGAATSGEEGAEALDRALSVIDEVAAAWNQASEGFERLLDEKIAPLTLIVERGAKATYQLATLGSGRTDELEQGVAALKGLGVTTRTSVEQQMEFARIVRGQSRLAAALRVPGARLSGVLERYASAFERIAALADIDRESPPPA